MYFLPRFRRGVYNRYRKGMPWSEMLLKDLGIILKRGLRQPKVLLCYPHYPSRGATIYKIAEALGMEVTNRIDRAFAHAIYWEYATVRTEYGALEALHSNAVINLGSRNISKDEVDRAMYEAFGYATAIDPLSYQGIAVKKSLTNAVHDGQAISCPIDQVDEGYIFQMLIDSSVSEAEVMDLRVPIVNDEIPLVYLNYRPIQERFKNVPDRAVLAVNVQEWISQEEQQSLIRFAEHLGLDFGELDVLRHRADGRLYVVDANNTPQGPPKHLPRNDKAKAIAVLADAFRRRFIDGTT
jgi:hypothetical protein